LLQLRLNSPGDRLEARLAGVGQLVAQFEEFGELGLGVLEGKGFALGGSFLDGLFGLFGVRLLLFEGLVFGSDLADVVLTLSNIRLHLGNPVL